MDDEDAPTPDTIESITDLAQVLRVLRSHNLDNLSFKEMAQRCENPISASELSRIFAGNDFPSQAQLKTVLTVLEIVEDDHVEWIRVWKKLDTRRILGTPPPP